MLTTQQCFNYCWTVLVQCEGLLCFSLCPCNEQDEGGREVGGDSWHKLTEGMFHAVQHHAQPYKLRGSPSKVVFAQRLTEHQSTCERWGMFSFAPFGLGFLLVHCLGFFVVGVCLFVIFTFPLHLLNCLHPNPHTFSCFRYSNSLYHPTAGGSERVAGGCLIAGQGQPTT